MEKKDRTKEDDKTKEGELFFGSKENTIMILNALFQHGHRDLPYNIIPGMSMKEYHSKMDSALKLSESAVENKPSIIAWLRSGLFEDNDGHVPLALLFIAWYEQRLSPDQEDVECNFRYDIRRAAFKSSFLHRFVLYTTLFYLLIRYLSLNL